MHDDAVTADAGSVASQHGQAPQDGGRTDRSPGGQTLSVDHCSHAHCVTGNELTGTLDLPELERLKIDSRSSVLSSVAVSPQLRPPIA